MPQNLNHCQGSEFACRNPSRRCSHHTLVLSTIANLTTLQATIQRAHQGMHQGMSSQGLHTTSIEYRKNRIAPIITAIPRLIRNILHHNPQANFQVGFTSLSICSLSVPCFHQVPSLPIDEIASIVTAINYKHTYFSMSI